MTSDICFLNVILYMLLTNRCCISWKARKVKVMYGFYVFHWMDYSTYHRKISSKLWPVNTGGIPRVMSNNVLGADQHKQETTLCLVHSAIYWPSIECGMMSIASITWLLAHSTKWLMTMFHFVSVLLSNLRLKNKSLLQKCTRDWSVWMEICAWLQAVFEDGWDIFKRIHEHPRPAS